MNNQPLVSTIIPTYNRTAVVREAIDSVLGQTYPNVEVIVVDDGSTDSTQADLRRYGNRIRVITQDNAGPSAARNRGIALARGELIAFLDSDDLWLPAKLERQVALLQRLGKDVPCCLSNTTMVWRDKRRRSFDIAGLYPDFDEGIWLNPDEVVATRFVLFNQGVVICREVLEKIGCFDENLRLLEDHELAFRLSLEGPWGFISEPLVVWRETHGSLYNDAKAKAIYSAEVYLQVVRTSLARVANDPQHTTLRKHLIRELNTTRRHLKMAQMSQMNTWSALAASKTLWLIERCRSAVYRRSPWFPKMKVERVHSQVLRDAGYLTDVEARDGIGAQ